MSLPFHPLANLFPLIEGAEFDGLVASVKANGLRDPIVVYEGLVLDGRNRQRACEAAEVDCVYHPLPVDTDPLAFVIDKNLMRRHLNESQRAYVAAKLANLGAGRPAETAEISAVSQSRAADLLNVSRGSVQHAAIVRDKAAPEVQAAVERGALPVSTAAKVAELPASEQRRIIAEGEERKDIAGRARTEVKKIERDNREEVLGQRQRALPDIKAGLILEDYEWDDEVYSRDTGMDRHAANHYPTSDAAHSAEEIVARRDIESIVDKDCVLAMWSTIQHLAIALDVMKLRRFEYKSHYVWGKDHISLGRWVRSKHEILLIGTRGTPPCPAPGQQWPSLIEAPKGAHSAKPDKFLEMLEGYFPTLVKIELNRRGPARPGWDCWGLEAGNGEEPNAA